MFGRGETLFFFLPICQLKLYANVFLSFPIFSGEAKIAVILTTFLWDGTVLSQKTVYFYDKRGEHLSVPSRNVTKITTFAVS